MKTTINHANPNFSNASRNDAALYLVVNEGPCFSTYRQVAVCPAGTVEADLGSDHGIKSPVALESQHRTGEFTYASIAITGRTAQRIPGGDGDLGVRCKVTTHGATFDGIEKTEFGAWLHFSKSSPHYIPADVASFLGEIEAAGR